MKELSILEERTMPQNEASRRLKTLHISSASRSDIGRVRKQNEDVVALCELANETLVEQFGRLYLLADGAGGHAAGEVASRIAVETITSVYYQLMESGSGVNQKEQQRQVRSQVSHSQNSPMELLSIRLHHAFLSAHKKILDCAAHNAEYTGMATTCVAAVVKGTQLLVAHVGDSRAYLFHASSTVVPVLERLTTDHSMVTELVRANVLSPQQGRDSPARHVILRALGGTAHNSAEPDITTRTIQHGDTLVLCCDGLWDKVPEEHMAAVIRDNPPDGACRKLIQLANEAGGEDNISVVVLSFVEST